MNNHARRKRRFQKWMRYSIKAAELGAREFHAGALRSAEAYAYPRPISGGFERPRLTPRDYRRMAVDENR